VAVAVLGTAIAAPPEKRTVRTVRRPIARRAPVPNRPALKAFDDCDQLRSYVTEVTVETLVRQLYWWTPLPMLGGPAAEVDGAGGPTDYTTTNVQEQGVDEPDIVKTDGHYLYVADGDLFAVVRSWPPDRSHLVSSVHLDGNARGLFLHRDLAVVLSSTYHGGGLMPEYWGGYARIELVDVNDRTAPRILRTIDVEGELVDARLIDGHLYVVISSRMEIPQAAWELLQRDDLDLPELDWDATEEERQAAAAEARKILRPLVEEIVAKLGLDELVPMVHDKSAADADPPAVPLLGCGDLYRPAEVSEYSVLSLLHLDLNGPAPDEGRLHATGVLSDGWIVYASARNLYVAQSSWWWWWGWGPLDMTTTIHKFQLAVDPTTPVRYAASGEVDGWLLNQFSMGEHDGYLRVATTEFDWWMGTTDDGEDHGSLVSVLMDNGRGGLVEVGRLDGIAPGERIYTCRFMGKRGFLVTFVQVDPLFTLDLSDPTDPRIVGELELPGYSAYLHPVGDDSLLAVGVDADEEGRVLGLAVSVFDVRDFANPVLAHRYLIENEDEVWSWSESLNDHHAFTYHRKVLSIPVYLSTGWTGSFSGLIVLWVDPQYGIGELGWVDHSDLPADPWGSWAWMRRSVYIEDALYSLSNRGVKVNELLRPDEEVAKVPFYREEGAP
jgi:uncharacterized secreted protein with C-terminal beta-propeller domain